VIRAGGVGLWAEVSPLRIDNRPAVVKNKDARICLKRPTPLAHEEIVRSIFRSEIVLLLKRAYDHSKYLLAVG
jgi:hypothetical protein